VRLRTFAILFCAIWAIAIAGVAVGVVVTAMNLDLPEARSFSIDAIAVDAELTPEGVLEVSEEVTYTFRGADDLPFTVGSRDFDARPEGGTITSIAAYDEAGQQLPTLLETPTLFEWDIAPATSGTYTYELRYTVVGAIAVGSDVVELNRQWIGRTSPDVGRWSAEIDVPDGPGELRAWAHGPLDGTIDVGDSSITASVDDIPSGTFVETRLTVPVERFAIAPGDVELLPDILAEEQVWADEANAARDAAQTREDRRATIERSLNVLCVPLALLALWLFWMVWRRWGRDPKRPDDIGDYWREVPDDPPAVADAFLSWRQVGGAGYAATILDLARRDQFRIEEVPVERFLRSDAIEHRFVRPENPPTTSLRAFERRAVNWLFKDGPTITKSELVARSKKDPTAAQRFWKGFRKEVLAELDKKQYVVHDKALPIGLHLLIIVVLVGLVVLALATHAWIAAGVLVATAIALVPLTVLHLQRTPAGARRHAEWTALREYLRDFSRLDEAPVGHLELWEHYLVAAVALGVSEELMRGLEVHYPEVVEGQGGAGFAPWYVAAHHGQIGEMGSFGSSFGAAAVSSFTPSSSGSGGGGGFSGGGGGGGGGGGFGAR
jgi:uncharacterized membrane protein